MNHPKQIDNRNYRSLIIAGIGTIGKSLITLGSDQFLFFEHIFAIDKNDISLIPLQNSDIILQSGDISDSQFLNTLMSSAPGPSLFVNLCSGTNNVKIRNNVALYDAAYLDLAMEQEVAIATLDGAIIAAAPRVGVPLITDA